MSPILAKLQPFSGPCMAGIDEAGRGPVLGPMVYTICYCPSSFSSSLASFGVDDSKALTPERRKSILCAMEREDNIGWKVASISPQEISHSMNSRNVVNLNLLAHQTMVTLIQSVVDAGVQLATLYVDTVGTPESLERYLVRIFPWIQIKVSKKADSLYPIVSAASIIAKVTRDHQLEHWSFVETIPIHSTDFGSGYPGDPTTLAWMKKHQDPVFGYPSIMRFSWSTCEKLLESDCVAVTWPDGYEARKGNGCEKRPMTGFFKMGALRIYGLASLSAIP